MSLNATEYCGMFTHVTFLFNRASGPPLKIIRTVTLDCIAEDDKTRTRFANLAPGQVMEENEEEDLELFEDLEIIRLDNPG